jgi:hypothetical protein
MQQNHCRSRAAVPDPNPDPADIVLFQREVFEHLPAVPIQPEQGRPQSKVQREAGR